MAPSATLVPDAPIVNKGPIEDSAVASLRETLGSDQTPLARRFRALFSLKHLACLDPATEQSIPAIHAIAAAFSSPSSLLKHELAYCLGQTRKLAAAPFLRDRLEDENEDDICRHEAAEALAALGDTKSIALLRRMRDDPKEVDVVRETCDIAVARLEWEASTAEGKAEGKETIRARCVLGCSMARDGD